MFLVHGFVSATTFAAFSGSYFAPQLKRYEYRPGGRDDVFITIGYGKLDASISTLGVPRSLSGSVRNRTSRVEDVRAYGPLTHEPKSLVRA